MGLKPDKPTAPDPAQTANQQSQYNLLAAQNTQKLNAVDKTSPFGSATYQKDASGNVTGMTSSLNPTLSGVVSNVGNTAETLSNYLPTQAFDSTKAAPSTTDIAGTMYGKGAALLQPQFDQARNAQDVSLTNRGLPVGSEARNLSEGNLARQQSLALSDLASQATLAAPAEQQRMINNARTDYGMPAQQFSAQLGNLGLLNGIMPQASLPSVSVGAPNYAGLAEQGYQNQMQQYNSDMSGLGNMAKMAVAVGAAPFTGGASLGLLGGMSPTGGQQAYGNFTNMFNGGGYGSYGAPNAMGSQGMGWAVG